MERGCITPAGFARPLKGIELSPSLMYARGGFNDAMVKYCGGGGAEGFGDVTRFPIAIYQ